MVGRRSHQWMIARRIRPGLGSVVLMAEWPGSERVTPATQRRPLPRSMPQVVVLQVDSSVNTAREAIRAVEAEWPGVAVLLTGAPEDPRWLTRAARSGAKGVVQVDSAPVELERAANAVTAGELWFSRRMMRRMLEVAVYESHLSALDELSSAAGLTEREREVAELVVHGLSNKEIARELAISEATVKIHLHHAFCKLHVRTRSELMVQTAIAPRVGTTRP